jgi:hypothetical protein
MAKNPKWTKEELSILKKHFSSSKKDEILTLLYPRNWMGILIMGM